MTISGGRFTLTDVEPARHDRSLWNDFANSKEEVGFLTSWLGLLTNRIGKARFATVLMVDTTQGAFVPKVVVPDPRQDVSSLGPAVEQSVTTGRPANVQADGGMRAIAYPIRSPAGTIISIVAMALAEPTKTEAQEAMQELHWAAGWLKARSWEDVSVNQSEQLARAAVALDLLALAGEHQRPEPAAMAVANELQKVLLADRVSIGMIIKRHTAPRIKMLAISYSAVFKKRSKLVENLEGIMEEAFDQNASVAMPPLQKTERAISVAHRDLVKSTTSSSALTAPLSEQGQPVGAITAERRSGEPFAETELLMMESVAALIGPVLEMKRRNSRWIGGRLWDGLLHGLGVVLGPRRLSWKLLVIGLLLLAGAASVVTTPFRIQAEAVLRGETQRAAVAPFNGFLATAEARAGDQVEEGEVLARLDDTDLRLEELRWSAEIDRLLAQQRAAIAAGERSQAAVLEAQLAQARAQFDLTKAELARTEILAPISGLVVAGDLSQRLGAPLQTGEVLFEISPLEDFRVEIFVDERDLRYVDETSRGTIALAGLPSDGVPFSLSRITPVSQPRDRVNTFRTDAHLDPDPIIAAQLRPGMEGIAKIDAGEALLVWIWTRRLQDWVRETAWTWQP